MTGPPVVPDRFKPTGPCTISVNARAWSFKFNAQVPDYNLDDPAGWVARMLRERLDSNHHRDSSQLQVRFRRADFAPGGRLCIQGFWRLPLRVSADVLRAWLQVDHVGSTWESHNGSSIEPDYDAWRSVPDQDYCTVHVLQLPASAQDGFGTFGLTNDDAGNAKLGDSFSVPVPDCTESTDAAIRTENAMLKADNLRLTKKADRDRRKRRREMKKAARAKKSNNMGEAAAMAD